MAYSYNIAVTTASTSNQVYHFAEVVPDKFKCLICTNTLCNPRLTECCGQHFCKKCLDSWCNSQPYYYGNRNSCPHCRTCNFVHIHDKSIQREINKLKVRCSHSEKGCQWVGELDNLQDHLRTRCGYQQVPCPNKCTDKHGRVQCLYRRDLTQHTETRCLQRKYSCDHCHLEDTYENITSYHFPNCPMFPLPCPNNCGQVGIKRQDIAAHQKKCPLQRVYCFYKCKTSHDSQVTILYRKDLQKHLEDECSLRPSTCNYCGKDGTYKNLCEQHIQVCPEYPVVCPNKCSTLKLRRRQIPTHKQECPLQVVPCPNKCLIHLLQRKNLQQHLSCECSLRKYTCEHCGLEGTYKSISNDHKTICPEAPLECPNRCGSSRIKRKNLANHRSKCTLEPVECPFQKAGCTTKLVRKDLDEHITSQTQQHLLLTFRRTQALEVECTQLKKKNALLEQRCQALEVKNRDLEKKFPRAYASNESTTHPFKRSCTPSRNPHSLNAVRYETYGSSTYDDYYDPRYDSY